MNRFTRVASILIDPAQREAVLAAYADYARAVADDDDVIAWELGTDSEDENLLHIVATFADDAAHGRHMTAEATTAVMAVLQPAIAAPPTFLQLNSEYVA